MLTSLQLLMTSPVSIVHAVQYWERGLAKIWHESQEALVSASRKSSNVVYDVAR